MLKFNDRKFALVDRRTVLRGAIFLDVRVSNQPATRWKLRQRTATCSLDWKSDVLRLQLIEVS